MNFNFNDLGILFGFDMVGTIAMGLISLFVGKKLKEKLVFLDRFGVPAAVIGGILFALVHLIMRVCHVGSISYDTTLQTPFMVSIYNNRTWFFYCWS